MLRSLLTLVLIMSNTILACAQWEWQNPWPQGNSLNDIEVVDQGNIWAAGEGGVLLHSTDGGNDWSLDYITEGWHIYKLFFTSPETGYATSSGQIYKTTNAGVDWYSCFHSGYGKIRDIQFISDNIGWASGEGGMLLKTENGGEQWSDNQTGYTQTIRSIFFIDEQTGWATGYHDDPWWPMGNGVILKTTNGGQEWMQYYEDEKTYFFDVLFTDSLNGIALGYSDEWNQGIIFHSNDGGASWDSTYSNDGNFYKALFTCADTGWVLAGKKYTVGSSIYKTTDGGISWTKISDIDHADLQSFDRINSNYFLAAGKYGKIIESSNGAYSWSDISFGSLLDVNDLEMYDAYSGWAVGEEGSIFHTIDGGINWTAQTSWITADLKAVSVFNEQIAYVISDYDILKTIDGGSEWHIIHQCPEILNSIFVVNEETVWVVGDHGYAIKTLNSGTSWLDKSLNENHGLKDIFFYNSAIGWIVGEKANGNGNGIILKTHDYGNNWTSQADSLNFAFLYSIDFINYNEGWAAGWYDFILHTSNGGQSWEVQRSFKDNSSLYTFGLVDISFSDQNNGWAVGYGIGDPHSRLYVTSDGGLEWNEVECPAFNALYSVNFINDDQGWLAGQNGAILYTGNGGYTWVSQPVFENHNRLKIFPNPTSTSISICNESTVSQQIASIYSIAGQKILESKIPLGKSEFRINVSSLKPGVYILVIKNENGLTERGKFIKY